MRVVILRDISEKDLDGAEPVAGWIGGSGTRRRRTIIPRGESGNYGCGIGNFRRGSITGSRSSEGVDLPAEHGRTTHTEAVR